MSQRNPTPKDRKPTPTNHIAYCSKCEGRLSTTKTTHAYGLTQRVKLCIKCGISISTSEVLTLYYERAKAALDSASGVAPSPATQSTQPVSEPAVTSEGSNPEENEDEDMGDGREYDEKGVEIRDWDNSGRKETYYEHMMRKQDEQPS